MANSRDDVFDATGRRTYIAGEASGYGGGSMRGWPMNTQDYSGNGVPLNGVPGFLTGATYQNFRGAAGSAFYVNVGSTTSSLWVELSGSVSTSGDSNTAVTATTGTTFTAGAFNGHLITRSGPTAVFTDTTPTAAAIIAALPSGTSVGKAYILRIINTTAYTETLTNGVGVTLSGITAVPANSTLSALVTYSGTGAVTIYGINLGPNSILPYGLVTALTTVGAGTITGAGIAGGITARGGGQSGAFTDTTDSVANIIAALPGGGAVGQTWRYTYQNETNSTATIQGASNVTVSGITNVPPGSWVEYLVTYATATTFTLQAVEFGYLTPVPPVQWTTNTTTTTFTAGELSGAAFTVYTNTQGTPGTITTRTATQMFGDIPNCVIGFSYILRIINGQGTGTLTVGLGSGVTNPNSLTLTIAANTWRDFNIVFTSATAATITSMGTGTNS